MAASPMPDPQQQQSPAAQPPPDAGGGNSPDGGAQPSPSSAPANPMQMLFARWYQTAKQMAASDPRIAGAMGKVADAIQEAQTAIVSPQQPQSPSQSAQ